MMYLNDFMMMPYTSIRDQRFSVNYVRLDLLKKAGYGIRSSIRDVNGFG